MYTTSLDLITKVSPCIGRKLHANAEDSSDEVTDPPKIEEKLGGHGGLSTDSDVVHRLVSHTTTTF